MASGTSLFLKLKKNQSSFPREIFFNPYLEHLELFADHLDSLPDEIHELKNLKTLSLQIGMMTELNPLVWSLPKLEVLKVKKTQLKNFVLPEGNLSLLKKCFLSHNQLESLPEDFGRLTYLSELDLSQNKLNTLPPSMAQATLLKRLNLDHNQMTTVPDCLWQWKNLSHLSLDDNPWTQQERQKLFERFKIWF